MDEEAFIKSTLFKKAALIFNIAFISTFFAFSSSGEKNPRPLPQYEPVAEEELMTEEPAVNIQISDALLKRSRRYHSIVLKAASHYMVDPALVKAIIMAESGYDPQAVSSEGASGLMQLMPRTAEALGVEDAFDPEHNVNAGVRYFKYLLEEFNDDIELALAAYNAGSRTVKRHQGIPPIKATQDYIKKVFAYYRYYKSEGIIETDSA